MHSHPPDNFKPCPHMTKLVSARLDNALSGMSLRYTDWHVRHCPRCANAAHTLAALQRRLRALPGPEGVMILTPERRAALDRAYARVDGLIDGAGLEDGNNG